ncbi:Smc-like protein Sph2 [Natronomonas moolapensis 8.8.11]|uniref:Smc-like protein Sph2 n=1 Tax=Natronomonas moolapensis (strain DSM 18674 / CECT 7526 / JCM 14361 / 8.8.11) TaxID=268739 RepID=M1XS93_NATM8|nr:archaea-specific SMC-related protein [Natronomonas moolapensis]CCQ37167.1 Smc-like protein Sph2 [Natronomonas moolapensis 8.8.11]
MSTEQAAGEATLSVRNIGGIDETSVTFGPGVTVLAGENATNRTSLLQAVMAALGSDNVSMKGDADAAAVELAIDGDTCAREFSRQGSTVVAGGEPYLEDPALADLFAFLLESNEARRAVATGGDLRDLIMRPVDTDEIQAAIERHVSEREELDEEIDTLEGLKDRLPALTAERTRLEDEIEDAKSELASVESALEAKDATVEQTRAEKAELEDRLADLRSKRSELEDVRYELETERESLESARARKRELDAEFEDLPSAPVGEIEDLEAQIETLRRKKRELESGLNEVQSVIGFNRDMLDGENGDRLDALEVPASASSTDGTGGGEDDLADDLLPDTTTTCWTCGSEVPRDQIEATVGRLRELSRSKLAEVNDTEERLEELTEEVRDLERQKRQREQLRSQRAELESDIDRSESAIERLTERRGTLQAAIADLEDGLEDLEDRGGYEDVLELHKEANEHEYELGRLEENLEDIEAEIDRIEGRLDAESALRRQREELTAEIEDLRTRIDRIEEQAVEGFNEHMDSVLEILGYNNLERIWLERVEREVRDGRRKVTERAFELHIVRQTDSGVTYEDTIDHLSESEREVTGLVFALAGYLAHEVYETVPFILLDSLEAIDSDRIAALVEYVEGFSEYLVVALLPEDAAALPDTYTRISDI